MWKKRLKMNYLLRQYVDSKLGIMKFQPKKYWNFLNCFELEMIVASLREGMLNEKCFEEVELGTLD